MQLFAKTSAEVNLSREKVRTVKENLQACKHLLCCRREELKKMYMDAVKHKHILEMLEQINELKEIASKLNVHLNKKHYLHATKTLMSAIELSEGRLKEVDGLQELRQDFENKRNILYDKLIEELNKHIYQTSTAEILSNFQRNNSTRISNNNQPFQRNFVRRSADRIEANQKAKKVLQEISQNGFLDVDKSEIIDDTNLLDPDVNSTYFIGIIVECFALLNKVPNSIEVCPHFLHTKDPAHNKILVFFRQ